MYLLSSFVSAHPNLTLLLYVVLCICLGIGFYFGFHTLKRKAQIRKNMKARSKNAKSN